MSLRRLFISVFGLLALAQLVPIWAVRFHPLPDLANHLAATSIWHNLHNPDFDFNRYYEMSLGAAPYWAYYLLTHLLAFVVGLDAANRIMLSFCVVGLPLGFAWLAHRFGRSPWLGLFAFPLAWNFNFNAGFVTFCVGLTILPFALVAFDWASERPSVPRSMVAAALGLSLFFTQLLPWAMFLGCAGLMGLMRERASRRELIPRLATWLVPFLGGALVIFSGGKLHIGRIGRTLRWKVYDYWGSIRDFSEFVLDNFRGSDDELLCLVMLLAWVALMVTARRRRLRLHELQPEACAIFLYASYVFLPRSILSPAYWWGVNIRFAVAACLFAGLCVPGPIEGWRRWLLAPVAAAAFTFAFITTIHWERVEAWMDGLDELATIPAPKDRVLVLAYPPWHETTMVNNFAQSSNALRQAYYGGFSPDNLDEGFPIKYKQRFPAPPWRFPEQFRWERHARYYDWVLAFQPPAALFDAHGSTARLMGSAGNWRLWRLPSREDAPPAPPYPREWAFDPAWRPPPKQ